MLYPYTKEEISDEQEALDDILVAPEEYHIVLTLQMCIRDRQYADDW